MAESNCNASGSAVVSEDVRISIAAQVFRAIWSNAVEGGSFRYLIYQRLGFSPAAYVPLCHAHALDVANEFVVVDSGEKPQPLLLLADLAHAAPMEAHPGLKNGHGEPIMLPTEERQELFDILWWAENLWKAQAAHQIEVERLHAHIAESDAELLRLRPA